MSGPSADTVVSAFERVGAAIPPQSEITRSRRISSFREEGDFDLTGIPLPIAPGLRVLPEIAQYDTRRLCGDVIRMDGTL